MIYDIHAHITGLESGQHGNYICPEQQQTRLLHLFISKVKQRMRTCPEMLPDEFVRHTVLNWILGSSVDRVVLLALDGVYGQDGLLQLEQTQLMTSNEYVAGFRSFSNRILYGASVHPYRKDALDELDRAVKQGACLIKWLPSAQNIAPDNPRCFPFYSRMAEYGIPLLCHTGVEHTLSVFDDSLNDPQRLLPAIQRGVTVIAAHCGTRMYLHERTYFESWCKMARQYANFYGDISAFALPVHRGPLRRILADPLLRSKILYGSDFPTSAMPLWFIGCLGWRKAWALQRLTNPLEKTWRTMAELGVTEDVFSRAGTLLRGEKF